MRVYYPKYGYMPYLNQNFITMEIKTLCKYNKSKLKNSIIKNLKIYTNGKIIVNAENGTSKEYYLNSNIGNSDNILDYSADYLICCIQNDEDINVSKY